MTCCGKTIQKGKNIAKGWTNVILGKKYEWTDGRIRICRKCEYNYWIGRAIFCRICKCPIPQKASVENEKCPKDKWDK